MSVLVTNYLQLFIPFVTFGDVAVNIWSFAQALDDFAHEKYCFFNYTILILYGGEIILILSLSLPSCCNSNIPDAWHIKLFYYFCILCNTN